MYRLSTQILKSVQDAVFPAACSICKKALEISYGAKEQVGCCATCLQHIKVLSSHICKHCGIPMQASLAPGPCGRCLNKAPPQQQTSSLYVYEGAVREALLAWKLQGDSSGISWLLHSAEAKLQQIFTPDDLLIPVPMPISRMRRSGLHHSANLCQNIAAISGCQSDWQILRRTGNDTRQSALKGRARQNNLCKAFTLSDDYLIRLEAHSMKGRIWVVDDILTTGATLRHACQTMRRTKRPVFAFSLARTLL